MIKGLYAAASAMLAGLDRQAALTHNLSNIDTPGFKQVLASLDDFIDVPVSTSPDDGLSASRALGALGLGVESAPETTDFAEGPLKETGEPLDLAIQGAGFFRVQTPNGDRYTRDGRFTRDAAGQLVTPDGHWVLSNAGQPIALPDGPVSVAGDGTITGANGQLVARLAIDVFADPTAELARDLPNTFAATAAPAGLGAGTVRQGALEASNVSPAQLMTQMTEVGRAYEAAQQMVQVQDRLLGQAIGTLGRLP